LVSEKRVPEEGSIVGANFIAVGNMSVGIKVKILSIFIKKDRGGFGSSWRKEKKKK